jgi:membrane protein YdbS with pleckstrin-like domain
MHPANELFSNTSIDLDRLPRADEMEMISLELPYKKVQYLSAILVAAVLTGIGWLIAWLMPQLGYYGYIGALSITFFSMLMIWYSGMSFSYMGYAVREKDITYKSGWLWKSMVTVPFNRVQHCEIRQGILDRHFGLAKLTIYTAGGQSTDLMIPGLLPDHAEKLKSFILRSTEQAIENE